MRSKILDYVNTRIRVRSYILGIQDLILAFIYPLTLRYFSNYPIDPLDIPIIIFFTALILADYLIHRFRNKPVPRVSEKLLFKLIILVAITYLSLIHLDAITKQPLILTLPILAITLTIYDKTR